MVYLIRVAKPVKCQVLMLSTKTNSPTILINLTPDVSPPKRKSLEPLLSKSLNMKKIKVSLVGVHKFNLETLYISETLALLKKNKVNKKC